jgi:cation:H+ antiporter
MLLNLLFIVAACLLLYVGASWLVHAASRLASRFGISKSLIGLTLVALGTSAPELFVNIVAGFRGQTAFALANVSGSNLTNICIGFGLCGYGAAIAFPWKQFRTYGFVLIASAAIVFCILIISWPNPRVPYWGMIPLILGLLYYLGSLLRHDSERTDDMDAMPAETYRTNAIADIALFSLGGVALYAGGELILRSAVDLATQLHVQPALIGLTIVAVGTSIPDTIASLVAVRRNENEIAIGNLLGSNISNIFVVLTSTMLASRASGQSGILAADQRTVLDYGMVCLMSIVVVVISASRGRIDRKSGTALLLIYFVYMVSRVLLEIVWHP